MKTIEVDGVTMLQAETCPNPECANIHSRVKVPQFGFADRNEKVISTSLLSVPGVTEVYCYDGYEVSLKKGELFSWDEIFERAVPLLAEHLGIVEAAK